MQVITLGFSDDLSRSVFELIKDNTSIIYPTRISAQIDRRSFEPEWRLERLRFVSMEDFKRELILMEKPVPEDDKRLLCLYQVLSQEDKEHFHLYQYEDVVAWGAEFFSFFEELFEGGIPFEDIVNWPEHPALGLRVWQEKNLSRIYDIARRYRQALHALGFTDRIFHAGAGALQVAFSGQRIIVVNQYYYSRFEREMLLKCEEAANELILIYHGVEASEDGWTPREMQLSEAWKNLVEPPKISVYECENKRQAALAFLAKAGPEAKIGIIDSHFFNEDYSAWFSAEHLRRPLAMPISHSRWYRSLRILHEILREMADSEGFIPIRLIIKYFGTLADSALFCPHWKEAEHLAFRSQLQEMLNKENLYLDPDISAQLTDSQSPVYIFTEALAQVLAKIKAIQNCRHLEALLAEELDLKRFASPIELSNTDLEARIWEALANFRAIETLGFVSDWQKVFEDPALGLFGLWLDYIKSLRLKREADEKQVPNWELSNLLDARNRKHENLAVFNLVEGILPAAPSPVWLLNEHQRKVLGLKYYDEIRAWERYYFFRLLLLSKNALLFTYIDKEKAIDHSSFIGEILSLFADGDFEIQGLKVEEKSLFSAWQNHEEHENIALDSPVYYQKRAPDFFCMPKEKHDFGLDKELSFGSYELLLFSRNLFAWYIEGLRKLRKQQLHRRELISPTLFGTLLHDYFAGVLGQKQSTHPNAGSLEALFKNKKLLTQKLKDLTDHHDYKYKIPRNYNAEYLKAIISERLAESLQEFYRRFLSEHYQARSFTLIPENTSGEDYGLKKTLFTCYETGDESYNIQIRGRADLRIESEDLYYIVDFKTGGADSEQLIFYEWLYYLLEEPDKEKLIKSDFWRILDMHVDNKAKSSPRARQTYRAKIISALDDLFANGYSLGEKSTFKHKLSDISRSDLYSAGGAK